MTKKMALSGFIIGLSMMMLALGIVINHTVIRPSTPRASTLTLPTPTSGNCSTPSNLSYVCNYNGYLNKVQLKWTSTAATTIHRIDNRKNGWLNAAYLGDYMFSIPSGSYPQGISNVTSSSVVVDISTNQEYGWGVQDSRATGTNCRKDILFMCGGRVTTAPSPTMPRVPFTPGPSPTNRPTPRP